VSDDISPTSATRSACCLYLYIKLYIKLFLLSSADSFVISSTENSLNDGRTLSCSNFYGKSLHDERIPRAGKFHLYYSVQ